MATRVVAIAGPTASGKSELGLELASRLGGEILCADSMQIYRRLDIGTAKPNQEERARVPHHLLDLIDPDGRYSASRYAADCRRAIGEVASRGRLPILVGGTGLYLRAALRPFLFPEIGEDPAVRRRLQEEAAADGPERLHARLSRVDPAAAAKINPSDLRRVIRAMEVFEISGRPITSWQQADRTASVFDLIFLCLTRDRAELYTRIERRADRMMERGFLGEVDGLLQRGYSRELPALQGLGYRELAAHLAGECGLAEAVARLKQRTRNYAKRQLTWFRHEPDLNWYNLSGLSPNLLLSEILRLLAGRWDASSNNDGRE